MTSSALRMTGSRSASIDKAMDERRARKTREQIARELAELEAAKLATQR